MSQWITEEQTPHLRLSAEAEEVLYSEVIVLVFEMAFIVFRRTVGKITRISDDRKICIRKDN